MVVLFGVRWRGLLTAAEAGERWVGLGSLRFAPTGIIAFTSGLYAAFPKVPFTAFGLVQL